MEHRGSFWNDTRGDAVVEATILFPIIIMIFAGLVLLAMYLPTRAALQRATQYTATAIATTRSDTWLRIDPDSLEYYWAEAGSLDNIYASLLRSVMGSGSGDRTDDAGNAAQMVKTMEERGVLKPAGTLEVEFTVVNYVIYKEIAVTATRTIPMPVDLSFVKFPTSIPVTVTSTAVVQNGDEFVRNIDLAADFLDYLGDRYPSVGTLFSKVSELGGKISGILGG